MERILQRGGGRATLGGAAKRQSSLAATRALALAPTRELAAQCVSMMMAMSKFTDLRVALVVGGAKNVMSQVRENIMSMASYIHCVHLGARFAYCHGDMIVLVIDVSAIAKTKNES